MLPREIGRHGEEEVIARHIGGGEWGGPGPVVSWSCGSASLSPPPPPGNCAWKWIPISLLNRPVCCHSRTFCMCNYPALHLSVGTLRCRLPAFGGRRAATLLCV